MKLVRTPLRLFDFDAHALRGTDFFGTTVRSREQMLDRNRGRILKPSEYRCALCKSREGVPLLEWEAGYQVMQCQRCDFATANFAIEHAEKHVEQTYATELYSQTLHDNCVSYFEYRKAQMGSERYVYLIERLGLDPAKARVLDVGCGSGAASRLCATAGSPAEDSKSIREPSSSVGEWGWMCDGASSRTKKIGLTT